MKVYIVDAKRTPIGNFLGSLSSLSPVDLTVPLAKDILEANKIPSEKVDSLILGNVLSAGHGQNLARQVLLKSGIPKEKVAYVVNMLCGSGLEAIHQAHKDILLGESHIVLAGGVESMSQAAHILPNLTSRKGMPLGSFSIVDTILKDGLIDALGDYHMGITAENIAEKFNITREEQDYFAFHSQKKALNARERGDFKEEIVPISFLTKKGEVIVSEDEYPNSNSSLEKLANLKTVFKEGGTITAGNASGINDGASLILLASEKAISELNLTPIVEVVSFGLVGLDPSYMGLGPVYAIEKALKKAGMALGEVEVLELNEAFASQSLGVIHSLSEQWGITKEELFNRTNKRGGAISLGHPLGASGARVTTTLIHLMKDKNYKTGIASLCIGGGMGIAMLVKKVN